MLLLKTSNACTFLSPSPNFLSPSSFSLVGPSTLIENTLKDFFIPFLRPVPGIPNAEYFSNNLGGKSLFE